MNSVGTLDPNMTYQKLPDDRKPIQLFVSPSQYIQGQGTINLLGEYLSLCVSGCAGVLITPGRDLVLGNIVDKSLNSAGFTTKKNDLSGRIDFGGGKKSCSFF